MTQQIDIEALNMLRSLVSALDSAFISSWQSTAHWDKELSAAREYVAKHQEVKEPTA